MCDSIMHNEHLRKIVVVVDDVSAINSNGDCAGREVLWWESRSKETACEMSFAMTIGQSSPGRNGKMIAT
jgi:hypothetical protein